MYYMHVCRIHRMTSHQIIDLAHHVVLPLRSISKEMDDLFNQEVDHTTLFYILPYYLANTPSFATMSPPPNSFDENYCAGIIISED